MQRRNLSRRQAEQAIRESDKQREAFVRQMFGRDIDEEGAYDMVIYTDDLPPEGVAQIIYTALRVKYPDWEKLPAVYALVHKR